MTPTDKEKGMRNKWEMFLKSYNPSKSYEWGKAPEWLKQIIATEQKVLKILRDK